MGTNDLVNQFQELLDNGIITQEEFDYKVRELMEQDSDGNSSGYADSLQNEEETDPLIETDYKKTQAEFNEALEQKRASMAGSKMLIILGAIIVFFIIVVACSAGSGSSGIQGTWKCAAVVYDGERIEADSTQADDYSFKFTGDSFEADIYGVEASGTYEYTKSVTLDSGDEVDLYTLTTDSGVEFTVAYFKSDHFLTFSPFGGISSDNYIEFRK